ncbi:MAG TPA: NUDIX hydrolase [Roseivirga sp.]
MLLGYWPSYETEKAFQKRMLFLLNNFENCFERSLVHAHFTASAWVVNQAMTHCLLTHHAKLDRWLQIGGHADGDADLSRVALKEIKEESGLTEISFLREGIFDLDIHLIPERKGIPAHDHYDIRYLIQADMEESLNINHESNEMRWVSLEEVQKISNNNISMTRMVNKTLQTKINTSN